MTSSSPGSRASRRDARERAVELGYEAQIRGLPVDEMIATLLYEPEPFAIRLLRLSEENRTRVDGLISAKAKGWRLERMPVIDLLVMRMAVAELVATETPPGVVLSEAVELVGRYSTEESSRFVNGVLAAISRDLSSSAG